MSIRIYTNASIRDVKQGYMSGRWPYIDSSPSGMHFKAFVTRTVKVGSFFITCIDVMMRMTTTTTMKKKKKDQF